MTPKNRTKPDLSLTSIAHQQAKELGTEQYYLWQRNVIDGFKDKSDDHIKDILRQTAFPYAVCFENWIGDFNMSTGLRNANAFNAKEVFYLGDKKFDRRGCTGVYNYTPIQWLSSIDDFIKLQDKYTIIGIDNVPGSVSMIDFEWPVNPLMVFGSEGTGLTPSMISFCKHIVHIDMFGSVRSLNAGTASGIAMNDFACKYRLKQK